MPNTHLLFGLTAATGLIAYKLYKDRKTYELSLPPSPKSYPIIGHLLSTPTQYEHLEFMKIGEELGGGYTYFAPLIHFRNATPFDIWIRGSNISRSLSGGGKGDFLFPIKSHAPFKQSNKKGVPLMVASLRADALKIGLTEDEADDYVAQIAITMFARGTDTKRAQAEIDSVLGHSRLPKVEDRAQLGYVIELFRKHSGGGPLPHSLCRIRASKMIHTKVTGYPKDLTGNVWAMTRDEKVYKDAEVFEPDRYLDPATPASPVFGWVVGVHFAQSSLFVTIASILMMFDIGVAKSEDGKDILPVGEW
ncbi:cytochrome P450 family [Rhizoctonia solani]|uniref:Cytochrome P450 family n=1 Tax=Rhizoctonia solani TaxID=456999 RepID=A0A8H7M6G6_9AGAM|nr:cytochrome P450 family [Rhizoctonia solani]